MGTSRKPSLSMLPAFVAMRPGEVFELICRVQ